MVDVERFAKIIANHKGASFLDYPSMRSALTLWSQPLHRSAGLLESCWVPADYVESNARIAIVGITPGLTQSENLLSAFRKLLREGCDLPTAIRDARSVGSFSGDLRDNLCDMLDRVGLPGWLGVPTTHSLFDRSSTLVQFTSALRDPVFRSRENYRGSPGILTTPILRPVIEHNLAAEVRAIPNAYWLPLWDKPAGALQHLVNLGVLRADRVLPALPHPAGSNNESIAYFLGRKVGALSSARASSGPLLLKRRAELTASFAVRGSEAA